MRGSWIINSKYPRYPQKKVSCYGTLRPQFLIFCITARLKFSVSHTHHSFFLYYYLENVAAGSLFLLSKSLSPSPLLFLILVSPSSLPLSTIMDSAVHTVLCCFQTHCCLNPLINNIVTIHLLRYKHERRDPPFSNSADQCDS